MEYVKGRLVWVKRLRLAVGGKDGPYWLGPFTVVCQVNQNSCSVQWGKEGLKDFHSDHLCP